MGEAADVVTPEEAEARAVLEWVEAAARGADVGDFALSFGVVRAVAELRAAAGPPRRRRKSWDEHFVDVARVTAQRSTCPRAPRGVGAVLVRENRVLATGYVGSIRGAPHCEDEGVGCMLDERGRCVRTVHAEINALLQAAQHGVGIGGATVYCTMSPCWDCFKALANGGVARIAFDLVYGNSTRQEEAAAAAGVLWEQVGSGRYEPWRRS